MDDRLRFERLYRAHAGTVLTFARRRAGTGDADDVVAEVFLAAWRRLEEVPHDPLPWLLGIARGVLANRRRSEARAGALRDRLGAEPPAPLAESVYGGLGVELAGALRQLSPDDQELLLLVAWERLSRRQIAALLGISPAATAVRLHRARARMTQALARHPAQGHPTPRTEEVIR